MRWSGPKDAGRWVESDFVSDAEPGTEPGVAAAEWSAEGEVQVEG